MVHTFIIQISTKIQLKIKKKDGEKEGTILSADYFKGIKIGR